VPRWIKLAIGIALPLVLWLLPTSLIPIPDITAIEHRLLAIFFMAVLFWVLEPIPIFATSVLIIALQVLTMSTGAIAPFKAGAGEEGFGTLLNYKSIMGYFAHPVVILFLGGFFIAAAATKYRLDVNLARVLIKPFGTKPSRVILGLMVITAIFSMFMSNTATTAMMLAVLAPVVAVVDMNDPGRIAMVLSIPVAANIGGIGTPIGTPPNAVALGSLVNLRDQGLIASVPGFGEWMLMAVPFVIIMLAIAWLLLLMLFKPATEKLELSFKSRWMTSPQAWVVYITSIATIVLWLLGKQLGLSTYVVALLPVTVFTATGIITAGDLKKLSWDVLWLIAGGFALGGAMQATGLSASVVDAIPFGAMPGLLLLVVAAVLTTTMATFMSNTATANLLIPLMTTLGAAHPGLGMVGGAVGLLIGVTFAASLGMAMPISTPPNAMAHATGMITTGNLAKIGLLIGAIGLTLTVVFVIILNQLGAFPQLATPVTP
jgi:sodium-dependent dicarboxylate transporter 2/3/5